MTEDVNLTLKVCFLGNGGVGKTSIIRKYVYDIFDDIYLMTIGTKVTKKTVTIDRPEYHRRFHITFLIWDIIGDIHFRRLLHHSYLHGAAGAFIVCDVTRPETLEAMDGWVESLRGEGDGNVPTMFIANKGDLLNGQDFIESEMDKVTMSHNSEWLLTSAKTGDNVEQAFNNLGRKMIENYLKGDIPPQK